MSLRRNRRNRRRTVTKICYESKNFQPRTLGVIQQAEQIIQGYQELGFSLTLRQLYYQFVSRGLIPNNEREYNKLGNVISDARRAGLIDWLTIEDRTRFVRALSHFDSPQDLLEAAKQSYHRDLWQTQDRRVEVWIEKDALIGVIEGVCRSNDVSYFSCRGYVSDSEMWRAAMRMIRHKRFGEQDTLVLHLGDHDPSGIDMTRDIRDRLLLFSEGRCNIEVRRIALTMEQIREQNPPPNPAKLTDSRYMSYVAEYGHESWELDALEPQYIANLITEHIEAERNNNAWQEAIGQQQIELEQIEEVIDRWQELF